MDIRDFSALQKQNNFFKSTHQLLISAYLEQIHKTYLCLSESAYLSVFQAVQGAHTVYQ